MFADGIGVERGTVEDWRYTANRWPKERRKKGVSFTVHRILALVVDEDERWAAVEDAPFDPRTGARQWTPDGAKRVVGQRVDRPVTVDEKVQAVADLTRDDEVAAQVATDLLKRPAVAEHVTTAERMRPAGPGTRIRDRTDGMLHQVRPRTPTGATSAGESAGCRSSPTPESATRRTWCWPSAHLR
ncbi:DUF6192 family protein [Streptomyces sp. NBC_01007]|nr:DUF6192 family protein [Streptomyces sp. NBC_01007]